jgi:hypothetical protein
VRRLLVAVLFAACRNTSEPAVTPAQAAPSACQSAIEDRNVAVMASYNVCSKLGGTVNDPTGACQKLIDAVRVAQERSVQVCFGK